MIPAFKKRTTVLFVDDDPDFLNDLCSFLPNSENFLKINDPVKAVKSLATGLVDSSPLMISETRTFPLRRIKNLQENFDKIPFENMISVAVIDHKMTPINGMELCSKPCSPFTKKIMLTSHTKKEDAIKAMNHKIIDGFILKTESDLCESLEKLINDFSMNSFYEMSNWLEGYKNPTNPLLSKDVKIFFDDFCKKNHIVEYNCFHDFNNIHLRNKFGESKFISIYTNEMLIDLLSTTQADLADKKTVDLIKSQAKAPCFVNTKSALVPPGNLWKKHMKTLKSVGNFFIVNT